MITFIMEPALHRYIFEIEREHWWYCGRRKIIFDYFKRIIPHPVLNALDIGCGSGLNATLLLQHARHVTGIEVSDEAIRAAKTTAPHLHIIKGAWPDISIEGTYNLITCLDVLEHVKRDGDALRSIESLLSPGGIALLTMPAFSFLWSDHDAVAHHHRRYTKHHLKQLIKTHTHLRIVKISYFNSILFLPIIVFRMLKKIIPIKTNDSDIFSVPKPMNTALTHLFASERFFLRFANLPFGVSLLCILKRE